MSTTPAPDPDARHLAEIAEEVDRNHGAGTMSRLEVLAETDLGAASAELFRLVFAPHGAMPR